MVTITLVQEEKPAPLLRDSRGTLIRTDSRVAYNRSGAVMLGKIAWFKADWKIIREYPEETWWGMVFNMRIESEDGITTLIRNPNSFVII